MYTPEYWKEKYKNADVATIHYAILDLKETLKLFRDQDTEYTRKLWSEWDYLITLKVK